MRWQPINGLLTLPFIADADVLEEAKEEYRIRREQREAAQPRRVRHHYLLDISMMTKGEVDEMYALLYPDFFGSQPIDLDPQYAEFEELAA